VAVCVEVRAAIIEFRAVRYCGARKGYDGVESRRLKRFSRVRIPPFRHELSSMRIRIDRLFPLDKFRLQCSYISWKWCGGLGNRCLSAMASDFDP
jgi:hypothetical protein